MSDIFREVDEELRQDRMRELGRKYGGIAAVAAIAIVVATGGTVGWRHFEAENDRKATNALELALRASQKGGEEGVAALTGFAGSNGGDMGALARVNAATLLARDGKTADAAAVYDAVANDASVGPIYRDLATLLGVSVRMNGADAGAPDRSRLAPLQAADNPWRHSARELAGLLAARAGEREAALGLFRQLADDAQAPAGTRARAADMVATLGEAG